MLRLFVLLFFPAFANADGILLICGGEHTIDIEAGVRTKTELTTAISIVVDGEYVETDGYLSRFQHRDDKGWLWAFDVDEDTWIYSLTLSTGKLVKKISSIRTGLIVKVDQWRCRFVPD